MKNLLLITLLCVFSIFSTMFITGCSIYKNQIPPEEAINKGPVKVYTKGMGNLKYHRLLLDSGQFIGVKGNDYSIINKSIPRDEILYVRLKDRAASTILTAITTVFAVGAVVGIIAVVSFAAAWNNSGGCNCPHVYVKGTYTEQFEGSLFPGAVSKSLERQDNLVLENVPYDKNGQVDIKISNELPEKEYLNQVELFEIFTNQYSMMGINDKGQLISYNPEDNLLEASAGGEENIERKIRSYDSDYYDFDDRGNDFELNKVILSFSRKHLKNHSMLLVHARQTRWLETVAEFYFRQFGKRFPDWVDHLDKLDPEEYRRIEMERGISMNAYILNRSQWQYIGSFGNVGTLKYRNLTLPIDISNIRGDTIKIKLETVYRFWNIDYAGLTDDWSEKVTLKKLRTISAVNQDSKDVMTAIGNEDDVYEQQPRDGTFTEILFDSPANKNAFIVLRGKGYYHHERNYTNKPNYAMLKELKRDKLSTQKLSIILYDQAVASMNRKTNDN